jgi:hypothetical protein
MTELEYEKSCRGGNQNPAASEFAWGNTSATALTGLSNASNMSETASSSSSNIAYNNSFTTGPVRTGIFATGSTSRATSGSGYYGNMELSGNLWERVVTVGNSTGRTFSGVHGNGTLTSGGASDVSGWPAAAGTGWKGGSWLNTTTNSATTSDRAQAANTDNTRAADAGGRGVRTISSGIVTDGLVLWLDAGITPSYSGSGTTWTDLSGNRNNGTLTNGPTYSSTNGGSLVFDGTNDYVNISNSSSFDFGSGDFTVESWIRITSLAVYHPILEGRTSASYTNYVFGIYNISGTLRMDFVNLGGATNRSATTTSVPLNTWTHVLWVRSGGITSFYVNSIKDATTNSYAGSLSPPNTNILIGAAVDPLYFNGNISNVRVYKNKALSAAEVLQTFNASKSRFGL